MADENTGLKRIPKVELVLLAIITLVAALLRLPTLGKDSLWNDELWSWTISNYPSWGDVISKGSAYDVHPPGYQTLLWAWIRAFGDSEVAMRSLSAVIGICAVPMLCLLGRRLFDGKTGLIAAAMLACVVATPIYYSQEVRSYSLLLLMSIVSSYALTGLVVTRQRGETPSWRAVLGFAVAIIILAYTHYFGLLLAFSEIGIFLWFGRKDRTALAQGVASFALLGLAYLPWLPYFSKALKTSSFWIQRPSLFYAMKSYIGFIYCNSILLTAFWMFVGFLPYILYGKSIEKQEKRRVWMLVAWIVVPWALVVAKSIVSVPMYQPRYFIICVPAAYLLLAHGLSLWKWNPKVLTAVVAALFLLDPVRSQLTEQFFTVPQKQGWREAAPYVAEHMPTDGKCTLIAYEEQKGMQDYYLRKYGLKVDLEAAKPVELANAINVALKRKTDYIWFLEGGTVVSDQDRLSETLVGDRVDEHQYLGVRVVLYQVSEETKRRGRLPDSDRP